MDTMQINVPVPSFSLETTQGKFHISDFKGKNLIIYFYPKDNTPGCTNEAQDFRDHYSEFKAKNTEIIGISKDSLATHEKFIQKYQIPFALGADPQLELAYLFAVANPKKMFGKSFLGVERSTFLIDHQGVLRKVWRKVKVKNHAEQVLEAIDQLK